MIPPRKERAHRLRDLKSAVRVMRHYQLQCVICGTTLEKWGDWELSEFADYALNNGWTYSQAFHSSGGKEGAFCPDCRKHYATY
jgi:RNase P/RNase MRP subunit p30